MTSDNPLSAEQVRVVEETKALRKKLRFAGFVARSNVVVLCISGVLTVIGSLFELEVPLLGGLLIALGLNEERGRRQLTAAHPEASRTLSVNQLALLLVLLVYCGIRIYTAIWGPDQFEQLVSQSPELEGALSDLSSQTGQTLEGFSSLVRKTTAAIYGLIAIVGGGVVGFTAWYYHRLRDTVLRFARAPAWARVLA